MGETYFLHADHLGRPVLATNATGALVWEAGRTTPFEQGHTPDSLPRYGAP